MVGALKGEPRRTDSDAERDDAGYVPRTRNSEALPRAGSSAGARERAGRGACIRDRRVVIRARLPGRRGTRLPGAGRRGRICLRQIRHVNAARLRGPAMVGRDGSDPA